MRNPSLADISLLRIALLWLHIDGLWLSRLGGVWLLDVDRLSLTLRLLLRLTELQVPGSGRIPDAGRDEEAKVKDAQNPGYRSHGSTSGHYTTPHIAGGKGQDGRGPRRSPGPAGKPEYYAEDVGDQEDESIVEMAGKAFDDDAGSVEDPRLDGLFLVLVIRRAM